MSGLFSRLSKALSEDDKLEIILHNIRPVYANVLATSQDIKSITDVKNIYKNYEQYELFQHLEEAKAEGVSEEEARAERKRRQRMAQEEFRQKQQLGKQDPIEEKQRITSLDRLLMEIPTQDIVIEESGASHKRRSPTLDAGCSKRRGSITKLDILHD